MKTVSALESHDDHQLLELIAQKRDKRALAEFYSRYRHGLGSFIRRRVYQDKLVDEIFNDVMLAVWQKADSFRGDSKVSTWVFGIAFRICLSQSRKEMKHTQNMTELEFDDLEARPSASVDEPEIVDRLRIATAKLNENHRAVIELMYYHGHSLAEIGQIIGCPINTVKTRLFHARRNLKDCLASEAVNI